VAFGSVVAHTAVLLVFQLGQPRIFFAMARDGLLPKSFAAVHPRFRTPHVTTIWTGVFVAVGASFLNITEMIDLTNISLSSRSSWSVRRARAARDRSESRGASDSVH
jgi:APA family basic amino acid/polyamine antiporter